MEPTAPGTFTTIERTRPMLVIGNTQQEETSTHFLAAHPGGVGYLRWTEDQDADAREYLGLAEDATPASIEVRPYRNLERSEAVQKEMAKVGKFAGRDVPLAAARKIARAMDARHVLVGWTGIAGPDGRELPFTPENAEALFKADPVFHEAVIEAAMDNQAFRAEAALGAAEALGNGSRGSGSGSAKSKGSKTQA